MNFMKNDDYLYIRAIKKQPVDRTPIWIMRQAGRYLPEYNRIRKKHDFLTVCKTPELATEVTLQPIRRFSFDAAILFSDILVIPEALGMKLEFMPNHGPKLSPQILDEADMQNLSPGNLEERLQYVPGAIKMIRKELDETVPLIGFTGSPFTLATYMIEGKPTRNFKYIKGMMYSQPQNLQRLLELLTEAVSRYLKMQIQAGAQAVQIFDTWGGILPAHRYYQYSGQFLEQIVQNLSDESVPVTVFSKGGLHILIQLINTGADMLGVDWMTDMYEAKMSAGEKAALQGNLDPTALYGDKEIIRSEVQHILRVFEGQSGHVFNLGHGILPDVPLENVQFLVDEVREQSMKLHKRPI